MAQVWHYLAGVNWAQHLNTGWQQAQQFSTVAFAYLAGLPRDCKLATLHAALVCSGENPSYVTPGFGPFALAWGWMCIGMLLGAMLTYVTLSSLGVLRNRYIVIPPAPPLHTSGARAVSLAAVPSTAAQQARQELLEDIVAAGPSALRDMALEAGMGWTSF